jgi:hypothetical protein
MTAEKRCPQCGETKPLTSEHWSSRKVDLETGEIIKFAGWCRSCHSAKMRERRAALTEEQREARRAYTREQYRLDMKDPRKRAERNAKERKRREKPRRKESVREAQRRWYRKMKADPERYAAYLESVRIAYRLRRERATGQLEGNRRNRRGTHNPWTPAVGNTAGLGGGHVEPLALWLETVLAHDRRDLGVLAEILGVDERKLRSIRHREYGSATFAVADTLLWHYRRPVKMPSDQQIEQSLEERCRQLPGNGTRLLRYMDLAEHVAHLGGAIVERAEDLWPDVKKA